MANEPKSTKEIAGRIEPTYHRRWHPLRRSRAFLSAGLCVVGALWIVTGGDAVHANGVVAAGHAGIENDCAQCHEGGFQAVSDDKCRACHEPARHVEDPEPSCAHCHRDHRGRRGLAEVSDAHCNACHQGHKDIVDFVSHVEFAVEPVAQRVRFNHEKHLDPKLQEGPLDCADCHVEQGTGFAPISFEDHCARCHTERIDDEFPEETVPHGFQPAALRDWVGAVYLRQGITDRARVVAATEALFAPERARGCLLCHEMKEGRIVEPRIPEVWHQSARFDHHPHRNVKCARCHEMTASRNAADLKLPGIATCRECHTADAAPAHCVTCHPYHRTVPRER